VFVLTWTPPVCQVSFGEQSSIAVLHPYIVSSRFARYRALDDRDRIAVVYATCSRDDGHTSGLDEIRTYRPYRPCGFCEPPDVPGFRYAGLTCSVIYCHSTLAIVDRLPPSVSGSAFLDLSGLIHSLVSQDRPTHSCHFVGQCDDGSVNAPSTLDPLNPAAQRIILAGCPIDDRPRTLD